MKRVFEKDRTHVLQMRAGSPEPGRHGAGGGCGDEVPEGQRLLKEGAHVFARLSWPAILLKYYERSVYNIT